MKKNCQNFEQSEKKLRKKPAKQTKNIKSYFSKYFHISYSSQFPFTFITQNMLFFSKEILEVRECKKKEQNIVVQINNVYNYFLV